MQQTICRCLYCGAQTGCYQSLTAAEIQTVCSLCAVAEHRDEAREVAVGLRPWRRPLSTWVTFLKQKALPEAAAAKALARWNARQSRIAKFNDSHSGTQRQDGRQIRRAG